MKGRSVGGVRRGRGLRQPMSVSVVLRKPVTCSVNCWTSRDSELMELE